MTTKLQTIIEAVQELSPLEQLNLISAISQSLYLSYRRMQSETGFWEPQTFDQLIQAQETPVIADIASLRGSFWPEDESADDFIKYIYQQRYEDQLREN